MQKIVKVSYLDNLLVIDFISKSFEVFSLSYTALRVLFVEKGF